MARARPKRTRLRQALGGPASRSYWAGLGWAGHVAENFDQFAHTAKMVLEFRSFQSTQRCLPEGGTQLVSDDGQCVQGLLAQLVEQRTLNP